MFGSLPQELSRLRRAPISIRGRLPLPLRNPNR
jgi:hypothetical protein